MGFFDALKGDLNENETEQERFTVKYEQYLGAYANHITVVVDNQTGVNYRGRQPEAYSASRRGRKGACRRYYIKINGRTDKEAGIWQKLYLKLYLIYCLKG